MKALIRKIKQQLERTDRNQVPGTYLEFVSAVNARGAHYQAVDDLILHEKADSFHRLIEDDQLSHDDMVDFVALTREVAHRQVGLRPYDVQLIGGLGLYEGKIVQMNTGEGKTLAAVAAVAARAMSGAGVHVLTFNDYLARRDAEWMGPIYRFMGLSVAIIQEGMSKAQRREAYQADITYLTAKEAGFDFLRDSLVFDARDIVQRPYHAAVVDEADSILIDEARIPLVIAGLTDQKSDRQDRIRAMVESLRPGFDYALDEEGRNVYLTESGIERVELSSGCGDLFDPQNLQLLTEINLALHAEALLTRDVDYIIRHEKVEIVDEFTGRVVRDRHWPHGLQLAIEAKEGLATSTESQVLNSTTLQHFLNRYPYLSGMTATAEPAAEEFERFYNLGLLKIPPNKPCIRLDYPDHVFPTSEVRDQALISEIHQVSKIGRPILVGTTSVAASEKLAGDLRAVEIEPNVLNARRDQEEARIVSEAGAVGAVTISTNMAGRGTDIRLGGQDGRDYEQVASLGGLYVVGVNRHESLRIDDQLRGRAGRQGDPGSSRFFISLEDELLARCKIADSIPDRYLAAVPDEPVDSALLRRQIDRAQRIVEGQNIDIRQTLYRYSNLVERQRHVILKKRSLLLETAKAPTLFQENQPQIHKRIHELIGQEKGHELERRILLQAIDCCWAEYLAIITEIRDGIHLAEIGGMDPFQEFVKMAAASFEESFNAIEQRALDKYASLDLSPDALSLENLGLLGPSSTWTYLVDDHAFTDRLTAQLVGGRNVGFAAVAALTGPLLLLWSLMHRFRKRD